MALRQPRAVIFDLDGTLVDSLEEIALILARVLSAHGYEAPEPSKVRAMVGDGARHLVARAVGLPLDHPEVERLRAAYTEAYAADPTPLGAPLVPGALELLDALATRGIPAVVCTNKPIAAANAVVARALDGRVRATIGAGTVPRLKPFPDPVIAAAAAANVAPADAWMVGDGEQDVIAAKAAGVVAIGFTGGYGDPTRLRNAGADLYVERLLELVALL